MPSKPRSEIRKPLLAALTMLVLLAASAVEAHAQTYSVLYNFGSNPGDPENPTYSGIIAQGTDGNLYSGAGGGFGGAAYNITPAGTLTTLYIFDDGGDDGLINPRGGLTLGTDGNFYGTTSGTYVDGQMEQIIGSAVFKMTPSGSLTTLYHFTNMNDGAFPLAPPIEGTDGNFYGTTCGTDCFGGGSTFGSIYKITPSGAFTGAFTELYAFGGTQGRGPADPLVLGTDGNFYGTTQFGGTNGLGVIFKITPGGTLTVLYNFDGTHGQTPVGPLIQASDGNFYGTTQKGGSTGGGVVFQMTPTDALTVLHTMNGTTDGNSPYAGLVQATDGNLYGVNSGGGDPSCSCGTIFDITTGGVFSVVYTFPGTALANPYSGLVQNTNGILYGANENGGTEEEGVFYSLNIGATPFVSLTPNTGAAGSTIGILGRGFTGATAVSFNGSAASFNVVSDTFIRATIPASATTGFVTVTTSSGTLTSNKQFIASTATSLTSSLNPAGVGQPLVLTATVAPQSGGGTPTGSVLFTKGTVTLGTSTLNGGQAILKHTFGAAGTKPITAVYSGDPNYLGSTSPVLNEVIVNRTSTTTALGSSVNPSVAGQCVTFTAMVSAASGSPTGTVTFYKGTTDLGTVPLSNRQAAFNKTFDSVGMKSMTAIYSGDTNFEGSTSSPLVQTINQATSTTTLASSPNPSTRGQSVTLTATVAPEYGGTPTGTVTFMQNGDTLGTVTLSGGQAVFDKTFNSVGTKSLSAVYSGDSNFTGSTGTATQTVN